MRLENMARIIRAAEIDDDDEIITHILADNAMAAIDALDKAHETDRATILREIDKAVDKDAAAILARLLCEYRSRAISQRSAFFKAAELVLKGEI